MNLSFAISKPIICPLVVDRDAYLAVLEEQLEQTQRGQGATILLTGEAGIGKSRIAEEAKTLAAHRGFAVLQGNCYEPDRALPYAPLLDLLRNFCATLPPDVLADQLQPYTSDLVKLLPELRTLWPALTPPSSADPEQEKRRLFHTLTRFLIDLAVPVDGGRGRQGDGQSSPRTTCHARLLILEDLHWCDDTSLEFLLHLARRVSTHPILLLFTYRSDETHPTLERCLTALARERLTTALTLPRLAAPGVAAMISAIFAQSRAVRAEFVEALYTLTDGNPFFVEEVLKALVTSGDIYLEKGIWTRKPLDELRIPRTVQDAVQRRIAQLSPAARPVLTFAALIGQRFEFALLAAVTQHSEESLVQILRELVEAQLVVEEGADSFVFRHALTRKAIYDQLLARERRPLHRLIAQTIEQLNGSSLESHIADLSHHFFAAGIWEKTLLYAQLAAERALRFHTPHAAVEQYGRAIEAARLLPQPSPAQSDTSLTAQLYYARGKASNMAGAIDAAQADYSQSTTLAQQVGDLQLEWQCLLDLGFLWMSRDYRQANDYLQRALQLAHQSGDPTMLGHTLNRTGNWHMMAGTPDEGRKFHQEALLIFEATNDKHALATTLDLLGTMHALTADNVNAAQYYARAIPLFRELQDLGGLSSALAMHSEMGGHYMCDSAVGASISVARCLQGVEEALMLARRSEMRTAEAYAALQGVFGLGLRGEYDRTAALAQIVEQIGCELEHTVMLESGRHGYGRLLHDLLAYEQAHLVLSTAYEAAHQAQSTLIIQAISGSLAFTLIALGRLDEAQALLDAVLTPQSGMQSIGTRTAWCGRVELALACGQGQAALDLVERLITNTPHVETGGIVPRLWRLQAAALTLLGQPAAAQPILAAACEVARTQELPHERWRLELALGKLYHAQSRLEEARQHYATAHTVMEALATKVSDESIRSQFLQRGLALIPGLPQPSSNARIKQHYAGLTGREREVVALLAQGLTNKAIADKLVLSERTVEKHVENVLGKLGFTTRAQAAVWAAENGLQSTSR